VTLFGNRVFADDQVKLRSLVLATIQFDWCSYKKEKFGHRDRHLQREDNVKTGKMQFTFQEMATGS
jgi:hypothetical protein